jgi:hypothetical protein
MTDASRGRVRGVMTASIIRWNSKRLDANSPILR